MNVNTALSQSYISNPIALTKRETEILVLISRELTTQEIADTLYLSLPTIETHRRNLMMKTNCKNMAGLVRKGFEIGILQINQKYVEAAEAV